MATARHAQAMGEVEALLGDNASFTSIEDRINSMSVEDEIKAALWLYARVGPGVADRRTRPPSG